MTPLIKRAIPRWTKAGFKCDDWHWFDLSGISAEAVELVDVANLLSNHPPPFRKCMVVWQTMVDGASYDIWMLINNSTERGILVAGMVFSGDKSFDIPPFAYRLNNGDAQISDFGVFEENHPSYNLMVTLIVFYRTLQKAKTTCYQPIAQSTFINQRRAEKGKPLKYDWRTVVLEPREQSMRSLGGTHASPRQHDRRGHQRVLRSGKVVWVRECKVGKAEHGVVRHVYAAPRAIQ